MNKRRKPQFQGCGYMIGYWTQGLIKGDTAWDVDWGDIIFDGKKWNPVKK